MPLPEHNILSRDVPRDIDLRYRDRNVLVYGGDSYGQMGSIGNRRYSRRLHHTGHEEGRREKERVLRWAEKLDTKTYHAVFANMLNQNNYPPEILWITKKR